MTDSTTENFWEVFANQGPHVAQTLFYRLYYDENGYPICYTMEDIPGNYIDIDQETFARAASNVRVVDKKLKYITQKTTSKLVPGAIGTTCDPCDVSIVVSKDRPNIKWSLKKYDSN
jgi:hypothetical protein